MDAHDLPSPAFDHCTTIEVAKLLGMAVRSVQLMVDRGELQAWKTPGGHRRISRASVDTWIDARRLGLSPPAAAPNAGHAHAARRAGHRPRVMLIEDSRHYQNLVRLLIQQHFPEVDLQIADDGIAGLAMVGQFNPQVLIVDILLPGIDGATLVTSLRSHMQFSGIQVIVITSLEAHERAPYAFALADVPLIHKPELVQQLPLLLQDLLQVTPA